MNGRWVSPWQSVSMDKQASDRWCVYAASDVNVNPERPGRGHRERKGTRGSRFFLTFRNFFSSGFARGQNRVTLASLSPLSWQHMQLLSICHILDPDTCACQQTQHVSYACIYLFVKRLLCPCAFYPIAFNERKRVRNNRVVKRQAWYSLFLQHITSFATDTRVYV